MATLASRVASGRWRISLRGHLGAGDLRRLERKCAPALEFSPAPLELDVRALSGIDEAARRFVLCLLRRGTILTGHQAPEWERAIVSGATSPPVTSR